VSNDILFSHYYHFYRGHAARLPIPYHLAKQIGNQIQVTEQKQDTVCSIFVLDEQVMSCHKNKKGTEAPMLDFAHLLILLVFMLLGGLGMAAMQDSVAPLFRQAKRLLARREQRHRAPTLQQPLRF
jgi:hypothetical protein